MAWLVFGPICSLFLAYLAFLLFGFVLGAGADIDSTGTPIGHFFSSLALPLLVIISVVGTLVSICMGLLPLWRRRR
jgi:hypothetical protein